MIYSIIFDWKQTLYDPDKKILIKGAWELLLSLDKKNVLLILIGKGNREMLKEVKRLKVKKFFKKIIFVEGQKDQSHFSPFILKGSPQNTYVIGDRIRSEIEIGNKLNTTTVWVRQGKFSKEHPLSAAQKPTYTVHSLIELKHFLQTKDQKYSK